MKTDRRNEIMIGMGILLSAFLFLLIASPYTSLLNNYYGYDTAIWNVIGKGISEGLVPYKDLFDHKGPILFGIYGLAWKSGSHRVTLFLLQYLFLLIDVIFVYKFGRLQVSRKRALCGVGFFYFLLCATIGEGAMCEEWCLPMIIVPLYYSYRFLLLRGAQDKHPWYFSFLYGMCFGWIAGVRLNNAIPICGIIILYSFILCREKQFLSLLWNALAFMTGVIIPWIPVIAWYGSKHALSDMWWGAFEFNFRYAVSSKSMRGVPETIRAFGMLAIVLILLGHLFIVYKRQQKGKDAYLLMCSCSVLSIVTLLPGAGFMHYFTVIIIFAVVAFWYNMQTICKKKKGMLIFLALLLMLAAPFSWQAIRNLGKNYLFITQGYYDRMEQEIGDFMGQIPEEERDSVWGNGTGFSKVFCISGITPCFAYFDNAPIHYAIDERLLEETKFFWKSTPPKWIVVNNLYEPQIDGLYEYVMEKYEKKYELSGEKHLELYRAKE